jgi:hypothetical protein
VYVCNIHIDVLDVLDDYDVEVDDDDQVPSTSIMLIYHEVYAIVDVIEVVLVDEREQICANGQLMSLQLIVEVQEEVDDDDIVFENDELVDCDLIFSAPAVET